MFQRGLLLLVAGLFWPVLFSSSTHAATRLESLRYSPDITIVLGDTTVSGDEVAEDNLAGRVTPVSVGTFPPGTNVDAYHVLPNGDQLLSFDITVTLPGELGPLTAGPADVVRFNGRFYSLFFDAKAQGIPDGVNVRDVTMFRGDLVLSFDVTVKLSEELTAGPADLVRFDGRFFTPFFDGAPAGLPPGVNLNAVHLLPNGHLLLAFDISGTVGGVSFDDHDVLEHYPSTGTWALVYEGSAQHAGWAPAEIDALSATPASTVPCDIDGDGNIDRNDIDLIFAARNTLATGHDDPRDADRDGVITVNDARICALQCTNPECAP